MGEQRPHMVAGTEPEKGHGRLRRSLGAAVFFRIAGRRWTVVLADRTLQHREHLLPTPLDRREYHGKFLGAGVLDQFKQLARTVRIVVDQVIHRVHSLGLITVPVA